MIEEELSITSAAGEYVRSAWLVEGPQTAHSLCVLLDGEHYRDGIQALPIFSTLIQRGSIPPLTLVFVSHGGSAARHADYLDDPQFARFIAEDVVGQARARVPSLSAERHLICGLSLSGLAAAHIALRYPTRFAAALCQSGSFWFEPDGFARLARLRPPLKTRFWLSVGDEETATQVSHPPTGLVQDLSQIAGVERARAVLEEAGGEVNCHRYWGRPCHRALAGRARRCPAMAVADRVEPHLVIRRRQLIVGRGPVGWIAPLVVFVDGQGIVGSARSVGSLPVKTRDPASCPCDARRPGTVSRSRTAISTSSLRRTSAPRSHPP
ncbi:MAG: alpha/beta hydrolase-fold protein [Kofleriaceae bacterium]